MNHGLWEYLSPEEKGRYFCNREAQAMPIMYFNQQKTQQEVPTVPEAPPPPTTLTPSPPATLAPSPPTPVAQSTGKQYKVTGGPRNVAKYPKLKALVTTINQARQARKARANSASGVGAATPAKAKPTTTTTTTTTTLRQRVLR
jgi:hypothetical protein